MSRKGVSKEPGAVHSDLHGQPSKPCVRAWIEGTDWQGATSFRRDLELGGDGLYHTTWDGLHPSKDYRTWIWVEDFAGHQAKSNEVVWRTNDVVEGGLTARDYIDDGIPGNVNFGAVKQGQIYIRRAAVTMWLKSSLDYQADVESTSSNNWVQTLAGSSWLPLGQRQGLRSGLENWPEGEEWTVDYLLSVPQGADVGNTRQGARYIVSTH